MSFGNRWKWPPKYCWHKYFGSKPKKMFKQISIDKLRFFCMMISCTCNLYLGLYILGPMNANNKSNGQKNNELCNLKKFHTFSNIIKWIQ